MQINNFQNLINTKTSPLFNGRGVFSWFRSINNKGLDKDSFQKAQSYVNIDEAKPAEKRKVETRDSSEHIYSLLNEPKAADKLIKTLEDNIDLTLEDSKNLFNNISEKEYDISQVMLIAARNSISKNGNSYIYGEKTPEIFKGIDKKEVADKLDEVVNKIFWNFPNSKEKVLTFKIKNKQFFIEEKGSGFVGHVYRIFDEDGNNAAIKYSSMNMPNNNGLTEIATLKQMTKDGVNNVPEFYMAHASDYSIDNKKKAYNSKCWMLYEYIDKNKPVKNGGITWKKWCEKYGLKHTDAKGSKQYVGKYLVDVGGIVHENHTDLKSYSKRYDYLRNAFRQGETAKETLSEIKEAQSY